MTFNQLNCRSGKQYGKDMKGIKKQIKVIALVGDSKSK
jgi:hypothetical protein